MALDYIKRFLLFIVLVLIQFFIIQELNFGTHLIRPMPYIWAILVLPFQTNRYALLIITFATGMLLDIFSDTRGMNAAACSLLAYSKYLADTRLLELDVLERDGYDYLSPNYKGWLYYFYYTGTLTLIHHLCFFVLNYYRWSALVSILSSAVFSAAVSLMLMMLIRFFTRKY